MIYKKYMRTMWGGLITALIGFVMLGLLFLVGSLWLEHWDADVVISLYVMIWSVIGSGLLIGLIGFIFARLTKDHDRGMAELDYSTLRAIIPQFDVWFFKRVMIFDTEGAYIGKSSMEITGIRTFLISLLSQLNLLTPLNYRFHDHTGKLLFSFKRRGWRSAIVDIWDDNGKIGYVEFDELKILLRFRGYAYVGNEGDEEGLEKYRVKSELLFDDTDGNGLMDLSSFRNDVKYHYIFRDFQVRVIQLGAPVSEDKGRVGLALSIMLYHLSWK